MCVRERVDVNKKRMRKRGRERRRHREKDRGQRGEREIYEGEEGDMRRRDGKVYMGRISGKQIQKKNKRQKCCGTLKTNCFVLIRAEPTSSDVRVSLYDYHNLYLAP